MFCRDKLTFIATKHVLKMILVAAPANDSYEVMTVTWHSNQNRTCPFKLSPIAWGRITNLAEIIILCGHEYTVLADFVDLANDPSRSQSFPQLDCPQINTSKKKKFRLHLFAGRVFPCVTLRLRRLCVLSLNVRHRLKPPLLFIYLFLWWFFFFKLQLS